MVNLSTQPSAAKHPRSSALIGTGLILALCLPGSLLATAPETETIPTIQVPDDGTVDSLPERERDQENALDAFGERPAFRLEDVLPESGISFRHRIVADAGPDYKMVHYDHGNGLAAADVDGDDRADLYFTTQIGRNELWRNLGGGRFEDITERAGVAVEDRISVSASFADSDNDGDPDLFVTTVNQGNLFFENLGGGRFEDRTETSGLGHTGHSSGSVWFDYDLDGLLDLFVANVGRYTTIEEGPGGYWVGIGDAFSGHLFPDRFERSLLYRNLGGNRFEEVSRKVGLVDTGWTGDALAADFDGDDWIDLYVPNMQGDDHLWLNRGGERFEEVTDELFSRTPWGTMGIDRLDVDGDGAFDLYLTDMHSDMSKEVAYAAEKEKSDMQWTEGHLQGGADNIFGNALYRQTGAGPWEEISDAAGVEVYWPWGVSAGDLDADGREDLFVTASMSYPFRYQPNSVLWNVGGRFLDVTFPTRAEPRRGYRTHGPWFEVDCSGADTDNTHCRGRRGRHLVTGTLGSRSSVLLDLDADCDLDVVTNEFNAPPMVLQNHAWGSVPRCVKIELEGTRSNRDGLGATVTVHGAGFSSRQWHDGKSGYLSQSSLPLFVGLGSLDVVDRIVVDWPSGVRQEVPGPISAGDLIRIIEPADEDGEASSARGSGPGPRTRPRPSLSRTVFSTPPNSPRERIWDRSGSVDG